MNIRFLKITLISLILLVLQIPQVSQAQQFYPHKDYKVWIKTQNRDVPLKVYLLELKEESIRILTLKSTHVKFESEMEVPISEIEYLAVRRKNGIIRKALTFTGVGFVAGAAYSYTYSSDSDFFPREITALMAGGVVAGAGFVVGILAGTSKMKFHLNGNQDAYLDRKEIFEHLLYPPK